MFRYELDDRGPAGIADAGEKLFELKLRATWCQPCTLEMPTLEALWRAYSDGGLVVLAVSVDRGAPRGLIEPYVRNLNLTFPILLDPELQPSGAWRVTGLPPAYLVRPAGWVAGMAGDPREGDDGGMTALGERLFPEQQ